MKEIKAIIKPFKLDDVITELHKIEGLPGITISEIKGFGKSKAKNSTDPVREGIHEFVKKVKLELVVPDNLVENVVNTIQQTAHTGNIGDGKIFIIDVEEVVKIRTNERGESAI
ncbi:nitrogen regulatory protein P-II [Melioribacter roseus P3M-2]|uniref:Nitrogen regulatory protein P-II n=1 Tax=Melioribacter roseus (strain DSM 23840 / JCM 17771 / VKM B-2668 / P3M-2) TaxID=1191523 RepID=I7A1G0_MELRP|nr:P-II family nitrogen regulator [Melioribacter roseus]AFN73821.1 nitrogen regulatory protein P-II [Melioribacter roseus P3M-2]